MPTQIHPMGVFNEWGKLREVLVGDSSRCVSPAGPPIGAGITGSKPCCKGLEGVSLQQAMPARAKREKEQTEALVAVLEDHGVIVHRPRPLSDTEIAASPLGLITSMPAIPRSSSASTSSRPICA